jgi:hypothetical protein
MFNNNDDENSKRITLREMLKAMGTNIDYGFIPKELTIRQMLEHAGENPDQLFRHPVYKEGYADGLAAGKQEANQKSKMIIKGIAELLEDDDEF